ncbi:MAG: hypothetical protein MUC62_07020 [Candidatus Thermoplasmatota archaeon]|jgi:KaiC/GvpD/RAD55 family RecA-like ATPase|nr:hypothetical protein [Candidatus Thermoplasmatota archaeon]
MVGVANGPSFGIDQLDGLSLGKLSYGNLGLLMGPSGTGKSTVLAHFLFNGAQNGESCCLVTDEPPVRVAAHFSRFRSFDPSWVKDGYISMFNLHDMLDMIGISEESITKDDMELLFDLLVQTLDQMDTKRLVIDPLNPLLNLLERTDMRFFMRGLRSEVLDRGMVAMLSYDTLAPSEMWGKHLIEQDMLDVMVAFSRVREREVSMNCLTIEKWRGSPHSRASYVIELDAEGVILVPKIGSGRVV